MLLYFPIQLLEYCIFFLFILLSALFQKLFCFIHITVPYPVFSIPCQPHCSRCCSCKSPTVLSFPLLPSRVLYHGVPLFQIRLHVVLHASRCCPPCSYTCQLQYRCCHMPFRFILRIAALAFQSACHFYSCNCIRYPLC